MKERIKVVRKRPGEAPELVEIDNTLEALQREVGGYIETFTIASNATIICNEEGRLRGLPLNNTVLGPWAGTIMIVGVDGPEFTDTPEPEWVLQQFADRG